MGAGILDVAAVSFAPSSKDRLTEYDLPRFAGETLFDRIARAVCAARCLPRKELFEAWEVARRTRRLFRGGRVVDVGGGHGLLAHVMLLLDDSSPEALVVDPAVPPSAARVHETLRLQWPRLTGRVRVVQKGIEAIQLDPGDMVVSCHACGALTDRVLELAIATRSRVAVLPCCHDVGTCDPGRLCGWVDSAMAIDIGRAHKLERAGYTVWTQTISADITPKNRLLLGRAAE